MKKIFQSVQKVDNKLKDDHVGEYAAECAYFTILSFIPFIIFFLTLIQFTPIDQESIYYYIKEIVPSTMEDMILGVIDEVYSKSVGTISIAVIFALWSSSRGTYYLCKGLRTIYKTKPKKTNVFMRFEGAFYTLLLVIAIIVFLVIMLFGKRIYRMISDNIKGLEFLSLILSYILKFRLIALIIVMFLIFLLMYKFVPKDKLKFKDQIFGALFSSVGWYVISWCFSVYLDVFKGFSNTYGSLTSIMLIMMWVYACMIIILIGGEINYFYTEYRKNKEFFIKNSEKSIE